MDLLFYKSHYVLFNKLYSFSGNQKCKFVQGRCLSSFTCQNVSIKHKQQYEQQEVTSMKTLKVSRQKSNIFIKKNIIF